MPKVLHVIPYLDPSAGGPPVVVRRLAERAASHGWTAQIITSAALTCDGGVALAAEPGIKVLPTQRAAFLGAGRRMVDAAVAWADLVHGHTMWSPLVAAAVAASRRRNTPYVLSPHGMLDPYSLGQKAWKKRLYLALWERRAIAEAASVIFTAQEECSLATRAVGSVPMSAVIALGADAPPAPPKDLAASFRAAHPDLAERPLVIFLGRLHGKKRPEAVIGALPAIRAAVPETTLLVAGAGTPTTRRALEALTARLELGNAVRFLGHLSGVEKWQALAASSVFMLPSRQENFAIAAAEALHAGVPVLITERVNIWREVVAAGAGFVVRESDAEADLASHAVALLTDQSFFARTTDAARILAGRNYTWQTSAALTHALYDSLLASRPAAGA